ncbi:GlsB/YeaQ/YmgE family stress response membrane protein [Roseomonas fluvialis]
MIGAAVASLLFGILGVSFGGWIGYLAAGVLGACVLIGAARMIRS